MTVATTCLQNGITPCIFELSVSALLALVFIAPVYEKVLHID